MTHRNGRMATMAVIAMAVALLNGATGRAQTAPPGPGPDAARAEAIRGALAVIEKQLAAHGGTWEKWAEDLKPYRDDIRGVTALKWPWPAKNGYVFQGAAHALHLRDSFDDLPGGERPLEGMMRPRNGEPKWPVLNLPGVDQARVNAAPLVTSVTPAGVSDSAGAVAAASGRDNGAAAMVSGVVTEISDPPSRGAPYPHFLMKFYLTRLSGADGRPVGEGDGVAHVLAMHNRNILPVARTAKGATLNLRLVPWSTVEQRYGKLQTGSLPTVQLEIDKRLYWGELEGQPRLTEAELARVGEDDQSQSSTQ